MPSMHALHVCLICMPSMHAFYACLLCMPCMYALRVCLIRVPYMYALYVSLMCMPYTCPLYVRLTCVCALHTPCMYAPCVIKADVSDFEVEKRLTCMPYMYAVHACLLLFFFFAIYPFRQICRFCKTAICMLEVEKRLICMPCMYAICPTNRSSTVSIL
jgi:hypothetical protein